MTKPSLAMMPEKIFSTPDLLIEKKGCWGILTLNRPHVLNALSVPMMEGLAAITQAWTTDEHIKAVIIQGAGPRAFCAGGDLRGVYQAQARQDFAFLEHLFRTEYTFTVRLHEFPKPYIAVLHGFCMGGGLGAAVHGSYRLICPDAVIAMPEVGIGYFPDVGAAWFLNQAPGMIGLYLGLTGQHIHANDAVYAGIATHFVMPENVQPLYEALMTLPQPDHQQIANILEQYHQPCSLSFLEKHQEDIDHLFQWDSLDAIMERLRASHSTFAQQTLATLLRRSPLSLHITFRLMKQARTQSFRELMNTEFMLSQKLVREHDFHEGIRAAIIDKDHQPHWQPYSLTEIDENFVKGYFTQSQKHALLIESSTT
jgi:enoyl-CoA hydratase/carnithine racemase